MKLKAKSRDYDAISHILYRFTDEHFSQTYAYCAQHVLTKRKKKHRYLAPHSLRLSSGHNWEKSETHIEEHHELIPGTVYKYSSPLGFSAVGVLLSFGQAMFSFFGSS